MSKSCWGGLRIGWIRAETQHADTIAALRPAVDVGTATLEQLATARLLASPTNGFPERRNIFDRGGSYC